VSGDDERPSKPPSAEPSVESIRATMPVQRRPAPARPQTLDIPAEDLPAPPPVPASAPEHTLLRRVAAPPSVPPGSSVDPFSMTMPSQPPPATDIDPFSQTIASHPPPATSDSQLSPSYKKPIRRPAATPSFPTLRSAAPEQEGDDERPSMPPSAEPSVEPIRATMPVQRRPAPARPQTLNIPADDLPAPPPDPASAPEHTLLRRMVAPPSAPPGSSVDPFSRTMPSQPPPATDIDPFSQTIASPPPPASDIDPFSRTIASRPPPATSDSQLSPTYQRPFPRPAALPSFPTLRSAAPEQEATPEAPAAREALDRDDRHLLSGKYLLLSKLGAGGMGLVYKGEHVLLGTPVAIKTMHPHIAANPDDRRRFLREGRAASLLRHPNVVQVLDCAEDAGLVYLVMEFVEGRSLAGWLDHSGKLPPIAEVARLLRMILDALELAHERGIVHRDLKPDNVLVTELGGRPVAKVTDFGIAHFEDMLDPGPTLTARDMIAGTPEYMSPEQCRSMQVGPSADLYAVGCILTAMLQGRPPFSGAAPVEIFTRHLFSPPPPLDRPAGAEPVPPLLERLRLDLLAKHPDRRPASAAETRARLEAALSPEAEEAQLPGRKQGAPAGGRMDRVPDWAGTASAAPAAAAGAAAAAVGSTAAVGLVRAGAGGAGAVDQACTTGLEAQGLEIREAAADPAALAALAAAGCGVVMIDAGADVEAARALLGTLAAAAPRLRAVVCAAGIGADRLSALVAAGAADVVRAPVTADVLGRKLWRVIRRGR